MNTDTLQAIIGALGIHGLIAFVVFAVNASDALDVRSSRLRRQQSARLALTAWAWPWHAVLAVAGMFGRLREEAKP